MHRSFLFYLIFFGVFLHNDLPKCSFFIMILLFCYNLHTERFLSALCMLFIIFNFVICWGFCLPSPSPSSPVPLRLQGETVHRDGEWDGQRGEVSWWTQPKVSGQLPRLPPALQQPQPQSQRLPALPHRYSPAVLRAFTSVMI